MSYSDLIERTAEVQAEVFKAEPILAIDPGTTESAVVLYDVIAKRPLYAEKLPNLEVLAFLGLAVPAPLAIEMVASYGMAVGAEVFETCVWIGRFAMHREAAYPWSETRLVYRREVKLHICGDSRARDANIRQAIIDRYGGKAAAIGLKKTPGPLYGLTGDCWQALGVAITAAETEVPA